MHAKPSAVQIAIESSHIRRKQGLPSYTRMLISKKIGELRVEKHTR